MKKHAWLVIAHNEMDLLKMLIRMLDDARNDIYIHIDTKSFSPEWETVSEAAHKSNVKILSEINVTWGGASQIQTELLLYREASEKHYSYYHLLSGADLPVRDQDYIHRFFEENDGMEFIEIENDETVEKFDIVSRFRYYHFYIKRSRFFWDAKKLSIAIQKAIGIRRNENVIPYFGPNWASLTDRAVHYLLSCEDEIMRIFHHTLTCDEVYKPVMLMREAWFQESLYRKPVSETCISYHLRYIDWKKGNPHVLTMEDYNDIKKSPAILARKFSLKVDREIVNKLYSEVTRDVPGM